MRLRRGLALVLVAAVMLLPVSPSPALVQDGPTESPEPVLWIDREGRKVAVPLEQNGGKTYTTVPSGDEMIRVPVDLEWGDEIASVHVPGTEPRRERSGMHRFRWYVGRLGGAGAGQSFDYCHHSKEWRCWFGGKDCRSASILDRHRDSGRAHLLLDAPHAERVWTYYGFGIRSNFTALCTDFGVIFNTVQQYRALLLETRAYSWVAPSLSCTAGT